MKEEGFAAGKSQTWRASEGQSQSRLTTGGAHAVSQQCHYRQYR
jgi:hypothetical protein